MPWNNDTGKTLFLNADKSAVVEEGPEAAWVLVGPDGEVSDEDCARYGIGPNAPKKPPPKAKSG